MENILFVSLGCDKNTVDSEKMIGILVKAGFKFTENEYDADIIIVNTCCFIGDAKEESINSLIEYGELKNNGKCKLLIACGCLAQRYPDEIKESLPEVDAIIGTTAYDKIVEVIKKLKEEKCSTVEVLEDINRLPCVKEPRVITTTGRYEYLKIAEGCNKNCSYCIIPKVRGNYRSVSMEALIDEANQLATSGVNELILVAQETSLYGVDLYGKKMLPQLLKRLCEVEGIKWIRILYLYPEEITEELLDVMASEEKVCNYLDLPIQHCNNRILKLMGRRTNKEELIDKITLIRTKLKDVVLRTTLITGFPSETEEEHKEVLEFIKEIRFDRLGCFKYSPEEDTVAAAMDCQIDEQVKSKWLDEIMTIQQEIAFERANMHIGKELDVVIDGRLVEEEMYVGRSYMDTPGVDGYVFVRSEGDDLETGDIIKTRIVASSGYDLIGDMVL